jgi:hypothetical protein
VKIELSHYRVADHLDASRQIARAQLSAVASLGWDDERGNTDTMKPPLRTKYKVSFIDSPDDRFYSRLFFDWKKGRTMRFDFSMYL